MAQKKKPHATNYIEPGQKRYIKQLEDAGNISGRTQKEADDEAKIDAVFEPEQVETEDESFVEKIWRNVMD